MSKVNIKKKSKKKVDGILYNWRDLRTNHPKEEAYAEAYFNGAWCSINTSEAVYLLTNLTPDEFAVIIDYPIWM